MAASESAAHATPENIAQILDEGGIGDVSELYDVFWDYHSKTLPEDEEEMSSMEMISEPSESSDDEGKEDAFFIIEDPLQPEKPGEVEEHFSPSAGKPDVKSREKAECSCKLFSGKPCHERFDEKELVEMRFSHLEMSSTELDLVVLSQISSGIQSDSKTRTSKRKEQHERQRVRMKYHFNGYPICREVFMYMHAVGKYKLYALMTHYLENGVVPRQHGNVARAPKHALSTLDKRKIVSFIQNFAEAHAVFLPGRIPGYKRDDLRLLPSAYTKSLVYEQYASACATEGTDPVAKRTFQSIWKQYLPHVLPMKPMTDLCWMCQKNTSLLVKMSNTTDADKIEAVNRAQQHLQQASAEREEYRRVVQEAKDAVLSEQLTKLRDPGSHFPDCSRDMKSHYSFDFAQQVHYPSNPLQPGPIFFKTPRKCGIFGVMTEALPQMCLFLLDESVDTGKGANTVISLLDFFLENYGLKETICHFHADNCSGQNKNNAMLQYLLWRVVTGRHQSITISFLLAGHTKFAPDWCFGLFKKKFRKSQIDCLQDICSAAKESSPSGIIVPQLCGDETGSVIVPTRDWTTHLSKYFNKLPGLKKCHHFHFLPNGEVHSRLFCNSPVEIVNLKKADIPNDELPPIIKPAGLKRERQMYLYKEIRPFVSDQYQDLVCPKPDETQRAGAVDEPVAGPSGMQTGPPEERKEAKRKPGHPKKKPRGPAARKSIE